MRVLPPAGCAYGQQVNVFFSAHGVPKSYVEEAGDPYKEEMEECVALIMDELRRRGRVNPHTLAYQSRVGPVEWLQPYTDDSIRWGSVGFCVGVPRVLRCFRRFTGSVKPGWCEAGANRHDTLAY